MVMSAEVAAAVHSIGHSVCCPLVDMTMLKEELHNRFNLSLEERVNIFKHNSENLMKIG